MRLPCQNSVVPTPMVTPLEHLNKASRYYGELWPVALNIRKGKGDWLPDWPDWCFLPSHYYHLIFKKNNIKTPGALGWSPRLAALGAWRYTQGIYRFAPEVYDKVIQTELTDDLPVEILLRLPEWCVYIETRGTVDLECGNLYGFWAFLNKPYKRSTQAQLFLVLHGDRNMSDAGIMLTDVSMAALQKASSESTPPGPRKELLVQNTMRRIQVCLSLLLYLCSDEPDIERVENELPHRPQPKKTKKGFTLFPPSKPKIWHVGEELARQLTLVKESEGESHNSPRPHIRRAHWHGYWIGKKQTPERRFSYKWLPPILVNGVFRV